MTEQSLEEKLFDIACEDGRYHPESYRFIFDSLDFVFYQIDRGEQNAGDRHISVEQLLEGVKLYALDRFGPLSKIVLEEWGLTTTGDVGEVVFNLVDGGLLNKQEADNKEDFINAFDFHEAFEESFTPDLPWCESDY